MILPEPFIGWCQSRIGHFSVRGDCSHSHGESQVWKLQADATGETYYLKVHRRDGKREREIWAYTQVTPLLGRFVARLVGVKEETPQALLFSALEGESMERVSLKPAPEQDAWQRAGVSLAQMHRITGTWFGRPDRDGKPMEDTQDRAEAFWQRRLEDWIVRAERGNYLSSDEIAFARDRAREIDAFRGEPATATHHDYTPRNWIVSPQTGEWLGIIDFEHTCFDVRVADFKQYQDRYFAQRPDLEEAFFDGYGMPLTEQQHAQLRLIHLHQGVSGVVWSREHNDPAFETMNHAILDRLRREAVK